MSILKLDRPEGRISRRLAVQDFVSFGAAALALPFLNRHLELIAPSYAQSSPGVARDKGDLVFIPGASVPSLPVVEWQDATAPTGANRIAAIPDAIAKAPATASHYEAKLYNFPSGSLRVLTFKKGGPVHHQITFETEIYVLQGSVNLVPLRGHRDKPMKINAGDALFLPSGILTNPKAKEDVVILQAFVSSTSKAAKKSVVTGRGLAESQTVQWQQDGKDYAATKPEEIKAAPANAARFSTRRYVFDGNSIRYATMKKGGRTNLFTPTRSDVLIYIVKGHMRRKEGEQIFEVVAGDAVREKIGNPGYWDILEDSVFIATDAPVNPSSPGTGWAVALAR